MAYLLMRHAEKPDARAGIGGVDEQGRADPRALSVRGWQRAGALARWLAPADAAAPFGRPAVLRSASTTAVNKSRRPMLTLLPLAQRLGLATVQDDLDSNDPEAAADALAGASGTVVVAWRQDTLPALAAALAARLGADAGAIPSAWPEDRFDAVWLFERDATGAWRFRQCLPQLLGGDPATPIG
jgi:hypothetical protein